MPDLSASVGVQLRRLHGGIAENALPDREENAVRR